MPTSIVISHFKTVNELPQAWSKEDDIALLELFNFPSAASSKPEELLDLLYMSITDFEPAEAAAILLQYKLGEVLSDGQIQNISYEMMNDKVAEEYPDPDLHYDLYNINQLLFKAYNGKFPNTEASIFQITLEGLPKEVIEVDKEILVKSFYEGLKENNLIRRLFHEQLDGTAAFDDAAKVIWKFKKLNDTTYEVITSNYWIEKNDFDQLEFEATIVMHEVEDNN